MSGRAADGLWGKRAGLDEPYPLLKHLLDTVAWAEVLWEQWLAAPGRAWVTDLLGVDARRQFALLAGLHDIGKADAVFQFQLNRDPAAAPSWLDRRVVDDVMEPGLRLHVRHEAVTGAALAGAGCPLASVVLSGHHGRWADEPDGMGRLLLQRYRDASSAHYGAAREDLVSTVARAVGVPGLGEGPADWRLGAVVPALTGAVIIADWLASDLSFVASGASVALADDDPGGYLGVRRRDVASRAGRVLGRPVMRRGTFGTLFADRRPRGVQEWTDRVDPVGGLTVIMVPPGEGKTEAALQLHSKLGGEHALLFGLPTTATADAMFDRVRSFYGTEEPTLARLAHGRAALHSFYDPAEVFPGDVHDGPGTAGLTPGSWFRGPHRALAAPVTVGTCDQALAAALSHKYVAVRLAALSVKHVVLDEVHTYDPYQQELLCRLLGYLGAARSPVTLLSATLPTEQLRRAVVAYTAGWRRDASAQAEPALPEVAPYPGVVHTGLAGEVHVERVGVRRHYAHRVELVRVPGDSDERAADTAARARDLDGRVGVMVNTVDRALAVARTLRDSGRDVVCLHSRMTAGQREETTARVLGQHGADSTVSVPPVLVATQVVETSLDLDLDELLTDLAPATSLVQRSGRQWRHSQIGASGGWEHPPVAHQVRSQSDAPVMRVLGAWVDDDTTELAALSHLPYSRAELRRTTAALRGLSGGLLRVPEDVQRVVDASYVSLATLEHDEPDLLEDLLDQVAADRGRIRRAREVGVDPQVLIRSLHRSATRPWWGDPQLHRLTSGVVWRDDAVTRLVADDGTAARQVLLIDPAGQWPHTYRGDVAAAAAATGRGPVLEVLRGVVPVGGALGRDLAGRAVKFTATSLALEGLTAVLVEEVTDLVELTDLGLERTTQRGRRDGDST